MSDGSSPSPSIRISWVHPDVAQRARTAILAGQSSWEHVFTPDGDVVVAGEPPAGVTLDAWPGLAEHLARAERVREVVREGGAAAAYARFGASEHAVELAVLVETEIDAALLDEATIVTAVLRADVDGQLAYGHFLSRLVELRAASDPAGTVDTYERFVGAARVLSVPDASWPERVRVAEDGLASLYVRVGRAEDAEALFARRFADEPGDVTVAISAGRAFLEHGDVARAVSWLERGAARATHAGRADLATRLGDKAAALRGRMS